MVRTLFLTSPLTVPPIILRRVYGPPQPVPTATANAQALSSSQNMEFRETAKRKLLFFGKKAATSIDFFVRPSTIYNNAYYFIGALNVPDASSFHL